METLDTTLATAVPKYDSLTQGLNTTPSYANIIAALNKSGNQPGLLTTAMPQIRDILSPEGQANSPYVAALNRQTNTNVAQAQSDAMKRGLTGSDIEAQGMGQARATGQDAVAQHYAQTANQLSQLIFQAAHGDLAQNRETLVMLAQAMGQELTSQRDMAMFQQALQASIKAAQAQAAQSKKSSQYNLFGSLFGAGIGALVPGGGALAALVGSGIGGSAGSALSLSE